MPKLRGSIALSVFALGPSGVSIHPCFRSQKVFMHDFRPILVQETEKTLLSSIILSILGRNIRAMLPWQLITARLTNPRNTKHWKLLTFLLLIFKLIDFEEKLCHRSDALRNTTFRRIWTLQISTCIAKKCHMFFCLLHYQ